ncbi:uncharacterized protein LOC111345441 [Stylophora pistillata]|uniref:Uncharacterized protein n=1 Tax=Stylophora pistillata TaxID=50429 RepID=A0A2B4R9T8_STYPI|nr:uncharacterized protein LOC111345441 [Stylophora pistillata]PFX13916.1 hypothetical protein AWC38_SpisGene21968 [Stylophora pistillata]
MSEIIEEFTTNLHPFAGVVFLQRTIMADSEISSAFHLADPTDKERFFTRLRKLNVNDSGELNSFLDDYKYRKLIVNGFNRDLVIVSRGESTVFEDFTLQVWKKYYIEEDVAQIGVLQGSLSFPVEGVFVGKSSGRVYVCQECDDYQEQCIVCIAYSLEHFLVRGPQKLLEYNKPQCLFDNCYGCFDPLIKDRVLNSIGL